MVESLVTAFTNMWKMAIATLSKTLAPSSRKQSTTRTYKYKVQNIIRFEILKTLALKTTMIMLKVILI